MGIAAPGFDVEGVMTMKNQDVFLSGMLLVSILQLINSSFETGRSTSVLSVVRQPAPVKHILYNGQASNVYTQVP